MAIQKPLFDEEPTKQWSKEKYKETNKTIMRCIVYMRQYHSSIIQVVLIGNFYLPSISTIAQLFRYWQTYGELKIIDSYNEMTGCLVMNNKLTKQKKEANEKLT